ncbi:MAG TPA: polyprenyl synthetase family protein [Spirochaetota bacterium]|nr:polyprenyl synthetase family protein [Spirochaetota bacterium]
MDHKKKKEADNPFAAFGARHVPLIDRVIQGHFDAKRRCSRGLARTLFSDLREYCLRDGKRVRPLLLLLACRGYLKGPWRAGEMAKMAASLELMHSFLLVQDDIIDRSDLRRGKKTLHIIAGERFTPLTRNPRVGSDVALVMADMLMTGALELVAAAGIDPAMKDRFLRLFAETYERTARGQILDIIHSLPKKFDDPSVPWEIGVTKTAYYTMVFPLQMGYLLAGGRSKNEEKRIHDFALPLGLAFQIRDDILGVFGRDDTTGKPSSSDLQEGKYTFLVSDTVRKLPAQKRRRFIALLTAPKKSAAALREMRLLMLSAGAPSRSYEMLVSLAAESRKRIPRLGMNAAGRRALEGLVHMVGEL